jgi:hypothetical protein
MNDQSAGRDESAQLPMPIQMSKVISGDEQIDIGLVDSRWMAEAYPETFERHPIERMIRIPDGMLVKVITIWPIEGMLSERFWVEITHSEEIKEGSFRYFGRICNETQIADCGDRIGPMTSECFCDLDLEKYVSERPNLFSSRLANRHVQPLN